MFRYVELEISWAKPIQEENIQHCNILQQTALYVTVVMAEICVSRKKQIVLMFTKYKNTFIREF